MKTSCSRSLLSGICIGILALCASDGAVQGSTTAMDYGKDNHNNDMLSDMPAASWRGYPRLFTEKTSSLLSEALQMLHRAKEIKERRWLQMYVQRLAALTSDLEQSTTSFRASTAPSPPRRSQQQTVPTTGQISPPPSPSSSGAKIVTTTQGSIQEGSRELGRPEKVTQPSLVNEEDSLANQLHRQAGPIPRLRLTTETYSLDAGSQVSIRPTSPVVAEDLPPLVRKMHKLVGLGLTEEEIMSMVRNRVGRGGNRDDDGEKASTRPTSTPTHAPHQNRAPPASGSATDRKERLGHSDAGSHGLAADADDLVRQLEHEKFLPDRSADSWANPEVAAAGAPVSSPGHAEEPSLLQGEDAVRDIDRASDTTPRRSRVKAL